MPSLLTKINARPGWRATVTLSAAAVYRTDDVVPDYMREPAAVEFLRDHTDADAALRAALEKAEAAEAKGQFFIIE